MRKILDKVFISKCSDYEIENLTKLIGEQFSALGVCEEIKEGMTVVVKPNLIMRSKPSEAIITHPAVMAAVGINVKKIGAEVLIAESPGGTYSPAIMRNVYNGCGYTEIAEKYGFKLYTECKSREVSLPQAKRCKNMTVIEPYLNADYIIDIAKMKTHSMTGFSGAVKNLFGVVPGLMKPELHCRFPEKTQFAEMLVDLCEFVKPNLSVIDAVYGMEGDGPTGGESRFVGAVLSSKSPYAADVAALNIIGIKPEEIPMISDAVSRGVCPKSIDEIELLGDGAGEIHIADYKRAKTGNVDFIARLPKFMRSTVQKLVTPVPKIKTKECIGCGKCAESCPQKVIDMTDRKAVIRYNDCIRCFCCHEMCPEHIIDIKRRKLFNF